MAAVLPEKVEITISLAISTAVVMIFLSPLTTIRSHGRPPEGSGPQSSIVLVRVAVNRLHTVHPVLKSASFRSGRSCSVPAWCPAAFTGSLIEVDVQSD